MLIAIAIGVCFLIGLGFMMERSDLITQDTDTLKKAKFVSFEEAAEDLEREMF